MSAPQQEQHTVSRRNEQQQQQQWDYLNSSLLLRNSRAQRTKATRHCHLFALFQANAANDNRTTMNTGALLTLNCLVSGVSVPFARLPARETQHRLCWTPDDWERLLCAVIQPRKARRRRDDCNHHDNKWQIWNYHQVDEWQPRRASTSESEGIQSSGTWRRFTSFFFFPQL